MSAVLKKSGMPHQNGNENIGPRPNLPKAVNYLNQNYGTTLPHFLTVRGDQQDAGGASFGNLSHYKLDRFFEHPVPYDFDFSENSTQILRAYQDFKTGTTQKYNDWEGTDMVTNHHAFTIEGPTPQPIIARFKTAHNATIQTRLVTPGQVNVGYVEFKDPWLRIEGDPKYYDPPYGYRNLGMDGAELEPYEDLPLELFTASSFKGVFLDQDPNETPAYYSVRAPETQDTYLPQSGRTHRFHFWKWDALPPTAADFQNANAVQTPVVFKNPNGIVRANYKGTQVGTNYRSNGQKKFLNCLGKLFSVYEDANTIWPESSEDNGLTWNLRNNAQPLGPAGAQCPSLSTEAGALLITYQENASTIKVVSYDDYDQEIVEVASLSVSNPEEARLYPSSDFRGGAILTGWERAEWSSAESEGTGLPLILISEPPIVIMYGP